MNRNEEYKQLLHELELPVPALEYTLSRAKAKNRRRKWFVCPISVLTGIFVCFIILVNFYSPVAYACSKVPILKELAKAVTFSSSLTDAVRNEFVQTMDLEQTDNQVMVKVEYLIVDQKQVNVFFRLESEVYENLKVSPKVLKASGEHQESCSYSYGGYDIPNGQLQSITIDFIDNDVPEQLLLKLNVEKYNLFEEPVEEASLGDSEPYEDSKVDYVANFEFLLTFDPTFTALKKDVEIDQIVTLGEQQIKIVNMEVYPTHLRLNVADVPSSTAWLKQLDFHVETDEGVVFDAIANGITATGSPDSPMMVSYRADSPYFYKADRFKVIISGAEWLDKDLKTIHLDLATGKADRMPEGSEIYEITQEHNNWNIILRVKERGAHSEDDLHFHQVFMSAYYDPNGNAYDLGGWSTSGPMSGSEGDVVYFEYNIVLKDYAFDEVWIEPAYSHEWKASDPVVITVQ